MVRKSCTNPTKNFRLRMDEFQEAQKNKFNFTFDSNGYFESCDVPEYIGTCPNCGSRLIAEAEEWETISKMPTTIKVDCEKGVLCFIEYKQSEANRMPYVYWLPLEVATTEWVLGELSV